MIFDAAWWGARAKYDNPGRADPRIKGLFVRRLWPLLRLWFRPRIEGLEHLPADRPVLIVANHSGGMALAELSTLAALYFRGFDHIPIAGMAHPLSFVLWPLPLIMRWTGAIPSTYEAALSTLGEGVSVLVFPGGDHEATRPIWQWRKVDFNHRQGFLRIARQAGVPIVPLGIRGSHLTAPILWRSDWLLARILILPRLLGLKRFPLSLLGVVGAAALLGWAPGPLGWPITIAILIWWLGSPLTLFPFVPAAIRYRFGPPLDLFEAKEVDLAEAHDRVVATVQALVDAD